MVIALKNYLFRGLVQGYRKETFCPYNSIQMAALEKMIDADVDASPPRGDKYPVFVLEKQDDKPYVRLDMTLGEIADYDVYKVKLLESCPNADAYAHWTQVRKRAMCKKYRQEGAVLDFQVIKHEAVFGVHVGDRHLWASADLLDYVPAYNELTTFKRR